MTAPAPLPTDNVRIIPAANDYPGMIEITRNGRSVVAVGSQDAAIAALLDKLGEVGGG